MVNPFCAKAEDGFHCGHEVGRPPSLMGGDAPFRQLTARCCWCDATVEVTFSVVKIAFPGHGMGSAYEDEVWDLPVGWHKGDA